MNKPSLDIKLQPAKIDDYPTIQNLARFYVYDLSRQCGLDSLDWAIPQDGLYESFDFKAYFEDPMRKAYLIKVNKELAGFVLLNKICIFSSSDWNMGEFFIIARFQGRGIGKEIFKQVINENTGTWEVSIIPENKSAYSFWKNTISMVTNQKFSEEIKKVDFDKQQPKRIIFQFKVEGD